MAPEEPKGGVFGWIGSLFELNQSKLMLTHGLDVVIHNNFLAMCVFVCSAFLVYGIIMLFLNYYANSSYETGFDLFTLSNVPFGKSTLAAYCVGVYFNSICVMLGLVWLYKQVYALSSFISLKFQI